MRGRKYASELKVDGDGIFIKQCTRCHRWMALGDFAKSKAIKQLRKSKCKDCANAKLREWYHRNDRLPYFNMLDPLNEGKEPPRLV